MAQLHATIPFCLLLALLAVPGCDLRHWGGGAGRRGGRAALIKLCFVTECLASGPQRLSLQEPSQILRGLSVLDSTSYDSRT